MLAKAFKCQVSLSLASLIWNNNQHIVLPNVTNKTLHVRENLIPSLNTFIKIYLL